MNSSDKLKIDTPEQIALEFPLAGIGSRFLALAIDSIIQFFCLLLTFLFLVMYGAALQGRNLLASFGPAVLIFVAFLLYWGYFAFFEIIWNGQTPGKRIAKIRVIKESGRPITPLEAIGRNLMRAIDFIGLYGVGVICMLLNPKNKRLGDYVAGTVLVHDEKVRAVSPIWNAGDPARAVNIPAEKISPEELVLIETYLNRRRELDVQVRRKTAGQIVAMIKDRAGIEPAPGQSEELFLEILAREVRNSARYR